MSMIRPTSRPITNYPAMIIALMLMGFVLTGCAHRPSRMRHRPPRVERPHPSNPPARIKEIVFRGAALLKPDGQLIIFRDHDELAELAGELGIPDSALAMQARLSEDCPPGCLMIISIAPSSKRFARLAAFGTTCVPTPDCKESCTLISGTTPGSLGLRLRRGSAA